MLLSHSIIASISVQELAGSGVDYLPTVIVFWLGFVLLVLGTLWRQNLSEKEKMTNPDSYKTRSQAVAEETKSRTAQSERPRRRASAA
jgi:hypothetical protein